jgi:transcriptional regulator with XRE-family HTH domain
MSTKKKATNARAVLDELIGEPLSFGSMLATIRETDGYTFETLARRLGASRSHLCDIEKGRRGVSSDRAARWAKLLGYPEAVFVQLALQAELDNAGIKYTVELRAGRKRNAA